MNIADILKDNKKRVTNERLDIFNFLKDKHLFTYSDVLNDFQKVGRASVFRTLNLFLDLWVIRKVNIGDKVETYEMNNHEDHHEHMKCENCDKVISFSSDSICNRLFNEADKIWFKIKSHSIWILWVCKNCC